MKISILTLFPEMFAGPFEYSIIKRAADKKLVNINFVNIRNFGLGKHKIVDDKPYGGGDGMILKVDVLDKAIQAAKDKKLNKDEQKVILMSAHGATFNQEKSKKFSKLKHLIIVCGHYEGFDERIKNFIDEEVSIGDFILTGGEIPAMLIADSVARLLTGVIREGATEAESFSPYLEYPQYTNPREYKDLRVPEILLSGDHQKIKDWQKEKAIEVTSKLRPDLIKSKKS